MEADPFIHVKKVAALATYKPCRDWAKLLVGYRAARPNSQLNNHRCSVTQMFFEYAGSVGGRRTGDTQ